MIDFEEALLDIRPTQIGWVIADCDQFWMVVGSHRHTEYGRLLVWLARARLQYYFSCEWNEGVLATRDWREAQEVAERVSELLEVPLYPINLGDYLRWDRQRCGYPAHQAGKVRTKLSRDAIKAIA